jgi:hypothetical protein
MWPGLICKVFKMGLVGVGEAPTFGFAVDGSTIDLLQEHDVRAGFGNALAHAFQHKTTIAAAIAFVDVVGQNVYVLAHVFPDNECAG